MLSKRTFWFAICLLMALATASPVHAVGNWRVIWEGDFVLDEPPGSYQGYFLAEDFYTHWPAGFLRQEIRVTYLEDCSGGVISFHVIRFPPECGMSLWSIGSYLRTPERYHWDVSLFEDAPNGVGIVYDGRGAKGRCYARVNMRLLAFDLGTSRIAR